MYLGDSVFCLHGINKRENFVSCVGVDWLRKIPVDQLFGADVNKELRRTCAIQALLELSQLFH